MLSLKASRADNFYYGSVEDERSKKKKEKEIKKNNRKDYNEIKFEIPYTIICTKCKIYIYKGERFNSERRKAGYYLSTCFYSFSIFCKNCSNKIIIETNPKNCSYDIIEGARKKIEHFENVLTEGAKNNFNTIDFEQNKKKKGNPFLLLEINALQKKQLPVHFQKEQSHFVHSDGADNNLLEEKKGRKGKSQKCDAGEDKADEDKADEDKADEDKADENKADENKADENKADENKTYENKSDDKIPSCEANGKDCIQDEVDLSTDEDINDIIKENYKRNHMLKNDFVCNSNLRKQLRDIKKDKIKIREEYKKKNIFIDIVNDPYEDLKIEKFILFTKKHRSSIKAKSKYARNTLIKKKKRSIFDKKYLKVEK
ncbi:conserved Plasmodium protein, unknown function [Plasmodium malariae]|uniref:CWC16 domain-containing protein n=1 Tax=Plasmodium malariae TaxID=5858 RepID=A0A1D3TF85_PLAMA|nr:conserved Plasmodium protein, unknown function [Plasmodium malariae]SCP03607.1 conserved Plasmodium protein, unknown function [Plasmodium malariae]